MAKDEAKSGLIELMRQWFVSKEVFELRFSPVEKIVYTFTGLILVGFIGVLVKSYIH